MADNGDEFEEFRARSYSGGLSSIPNQAGVNKSMVDLYLHTDETNVQRYSSKLCSGSTYLTTEGFGENLQALQNNGTTLGSKENSGIHPHLINQTSDGLTVPSLNYNYRKSDEGEQIPIFICNK